MTRRTALRHYVGVLELAFVTARRQNHFFLELVAAIRDELDQAGVASSQHVGDFPRAREGLLYVLVPPHEWFSLHGYRAPPTPAQLRRTVFLCAEQPETSFSVDNALLAPYAGAVFDISPSAVKEYRRHRIDGVRHFQLGWTRTWSTIGPDDLRPETAALERDVDVLHLGVHSARRSKAIAAAGRPLSRRRTHFVLAHPDTPNDGRRKNFAIDEDKLALLRRAKILLNIHQSDKPYFEWLRVVQAASQGCAVVSEHSVAYAPFELGRHILTATSESLGLIAAGLLEDEGERARMASAAYELLRDELPLRLAVDELVAVAEELAVCPRRPNPKPLPELSSPVAERLDLDDTFPGPRVTDRELWRTSTLRRGLKDVRLDVMQLRRDLQRGELTCSLGRAVPQLALEQTTPAWRLNGPARVSVITALYNHAEHVGDALESALASSYTDLELVIVDDGSTDSSGVAVRDLMAEHASRPIALARHPVNRGLGATRNSALGIARGEYAFVLDADNLILRHGIERLVEELDRVPGAGFAYGMLERFGRDGPIGLTSAFPWEPRRLRNGNYIDAMVLWRKSVLDGLSGYATDHRLYGWEDYDLWCRFAEQEGDAVFVTQVVARYRATGHSMIATTDLSVATAYSLLFERNPRLFAGVVLPP